VSPNLAVLRRYAVEHHGVVTGAAAAALGVPATELLDLVRREVLEHVGADVYWLSEVATPLTEYAEAVALGGPGAVLADDAVLALHDLAQVNPRRIRVAVPHPLPAGVELPATVEVLHRELALADITEVEGIPTMTVAAALRACRPRVMTGRLLNGVERALEEGLIDEATARDLRAEFAPPTGTLEELMDELEESRHPWTMLRSAGWLSLTELAARRGEEDVAAIGAWVYARRRERALIVLDPPGLRSLVVPAFQLTAAGDPRPELRPLFAVLLGAPGLDGWSVWSWMTSANGDLAGDSPERVAGADPERVLRVATGFAAAAEESR
jgi:hypothetical protein